MPEIEDEKEASVGDLINQLVSLCSYLDKLYMQSHLIHLNIEGPLFFPLHEFYKELYTSLVEEFDTLAEFVRSMDYLMPMCERGLNAACPKFNHVKSYDAREMSTTYLKNQEQVEVAVAAKEGDKVRLVRFGDPNMKNRSSDPDRRKAFRSRHSCDEPKSKLSAGYWSCKAW